MSPGRPQTRTSTRTLTWTREVAHSSHGGTGRTWSHEWDDLDTQVTVNRRGDALVVWRGKGHRAQLWCRYERAGHDWSKPVPVTPPGNRPRAMFASALGDGGHVAIAWTTHKNRQIDVRRAFPTQ